MRLGGLIKSSLVDYPARVSCVVFTQGCNFRCGFCHNPDLIPGASSRSDIEEALRTDIQTSELSEIEFFEFLELRKGQLDGVVVTGGEPTIQADLPSFLARIKDHGFSIKLDTNGSNPEMIQRLLGAELLDYIAMDIKGPLEGYPRIARFDNVDNVKKSIKIVQESGVPHEFRTTVLPAFHKLSDFDQIGELIRGAQRYVIQGFRDRVVFDKALIGSEKFSSQDMEEMARVMKKYVSEVSVRENL